MITLIVAGASISFSSALEALTTTVSSYLGGSSGLAVGRLRRRRLRGGWLSRRWLSAPRRSRAHRRRAAATVQRRQRGTRRFIHAPTVDNAGSGATGVYHSAREKTSVNAGPLDIPQRRDNRHGYTAQFRNVCRPGPDTAQPELDRAPHRQRRSTIVPPDEWAGWPDEKLLDLRISQLGVTIEGSALEPRIAELQAELDARGLAFQPHFWLSAEWFSPDGVPGVAIPFYLAHPRLAKLERAQMLEVEGGTPEWCMKILRHEAGHAIDNAYKLRQRRRRQQIFGPSYMQYPDYYTPKPYSKSFVLHLDSWYAQSHPDEDFAETFAVWLNPQSDWRDALRATGRR